MRLTQGNVGIALGIAGLGGTVIGIAIALDPERFKAQRALAQPILVLGVILILAAGCVLLFPASSVQRLRRLKWRRIQAVPDPLSSPVFDIRGWAHDRFRQGHAAHAQLRRVMDRMPKSNTAGRVHQANDAVVSAETAFMDAFARAPDAPTTLRRLSEYYDRYAAFVDAVHWLGRDIGQRENMARWPEYLTWRSLDNEFREALLSGKTANPSLVEFSRTVVNARSTKDYHLQ